MAKKPMVTRTITSTKANILCLDVVHGETFNKEVVIPRTYKDDEAILKAARPLIENDTVKAVHVVETTVEETLYGMLETDFIQYAHVLPPRGANDAAEDCAECAVEAPV